MKYVYTKKVALASNTYNALELFETIKHMNGLTRDIHEMYPAPEDFVVPNGTKEYALNISADVLQLLSIWFNRGTRIHFCETYIKPACSIKTSRPRTQWHYDMVDSLPQTYIKQGYTTPQLAYDYGKKLIEACNKANLIPFDKLENGYKVIARNCIDTGRYIKIFSPNEKTLMEAQAELETAHTLNAIFDTTACTTPVSLSDIELEFYARVFDIKMPEWYLRASNVRIDSVSAKGKPYFSVAVLPFVDSTSFMPSVQFDQNGNIKTYDGNDQETKVIPSTYAKDAQPQKLQNPTAERKQLNEQIMFYLNLPIEEQKLYATGLYDYCNDCKEWYEIRTGCTCQKHVGFENDEDYHAFMLCRKYKLSSIMYGDDKYAR